MKKYILKGLSSHVRTYLSIDDIENFRSMIGSEIELCDVFRSVYLLPNGGRVHSDYIIVEEVIEDMNTGKMRRPTFNQFEPEEINCAEDMSDWYKAYSDALDKYIDYLERTPVDGAPVPSTELDVDSIYLVNEKIISEIREGQYNAMSLGCGLEDRNITDRYEAMEYGYIQAMQEAVEAVENADIHEEISNLYKRG